MKSVKQLPHKWLAFLMVLCLVFSHHVMAAEDKPVSLGMEIFADGQKFDSIKEYRQHRAENERLKVMVQEQAKEAKKKVSDSETNMPSASGDNPFIANMPDERSWKTVIVDPQDKQRQKMIDLSVEGQINQIKNTFEKKTERVENNKVVKDKLGEALREVAKNTDNAVLLMSQEDKLKLYQYTDPVVSQEVNVEPKIDLVEETRSDTDKADSFEQGLVPKPKIGYKSIYHELYEHD